jgi:hypothetical protein
MLDPDNIVHTDAKAGVLFLAGLPDSLLMDVFYRLMVKKDLPGELATLLVDASGVIIPIAHVSAALRRLSVVGTTIAEEIESAVAALPPRPKVNLKILPGSTKLREHLLEASKADKNIDGVARMAGLVTLLWRQLEDLYTHVSREQNPFMLLHHVNGAAGLYMASLEKLHRMQMDVGIVSRIPDKYEIDMQTVGAFQTYIGELDNKSVEQMMAFASGFKKILGDKDRKLTGIS